MSVDVVSPMVEPSAAHVRAHLDFLFKPAQEAYPNGLLEIRYGAPSAVIGGRNKLDKFEYFPVTPDGLSRATAFAVQENRRGNNVYVGVNPRKPDTVQAFAGDADDVEISFFHFADIDDERSFRHSQQRCKGMEPTVVVMTGMTPNMRPHLYWPLTEPCSNLAEWTIRQKNIATALGGDSVIDPPRIMRIAGTVNYPTQKKLADGYRVELTEFRSNFGQERPPRSAEDINQFFPYSSAPALTNAVGTGGQRLSGEGKTSRLIRTALSGHNWHNSTRDLMARLARMGRTDDEMYLMAAGLTHAGYTVDDTLADVRKFIESARSKYGIAQPEDEEDFEKSSSDEDAEFFELLDLDELEALPPPTWLVNELIADHGLSIIYGEPGAGKSFIALDMALRIAHGLDWHGTDAKQAGVIYIAGEGARGLGKRVKGWRREHAMEGQDVPFLLLPVAVQLLEPNDRRKLLRTLESAIERIGWQVGLVVIDTVSRAIAGQDENSQESMTLFVNACNAVQNFTGGAVIGVHHSGKDATRGMRGSTVLLGGCDASIRLTKEDSGEVKLEVEKQKDAEQGEPIYMKMRKQIWEQDGKEETTLVPFRDGFVPEKERELAKSEINRVFDMIADGWSDKSPWSTLKQAKRRGRYLPSVMRDNFDITEEKAYGYITAWLENGFLRYGTCDQRNKVNGLEVIKRLEL